MNSKLKYWIASIVFIFWLVLAWFIARWLHLQGPSVWILRGALALIGIIAFVIVIWWFIVRDKERAEMGPATGGDEIDILIREATTRLQASRLGRTAHVGNLPLFLFLGEPGSAKTSVVLHSGLEPELLSGQTVQGKVPIPTRTANLWFSRQYLFAEAGGPMLQDQPRWTKFVRRLAPRQLHSVLGKGAPSPRAAVVCVDCETFMQQGATEAIAATSERIQTRLREVSQLLGISLPVYVIFTRADRLQFFLDYVRNFTNDEASLVFGATLPMVTYATGVYAEQESARISAEFDNLFQSLADRRINLLSQEFDATKLPTTYEFPREFRKLRPLLVQMLVDICRPSQLRTGPFLRGFYFSGVRPVVVTTAGPTVAQEEMMAQSAAEEVGGATSVFEIRKVKAAMAQQAASEARESRRVPQWIFLPHVFSDIFLKDNRALDASASSTKTSVWRRILLASATFIFLIFLLGFIISFARNKSLESDAVAASQGFSDVQLTSQQLPSMDSLSKLEALRQVLVTLSDYQDNGKPFSMGWGLYEGNALLPDVRNLYFQQFKLLLFGSAQAELTRFLSSLPATPAPTDPYDPPYNALKAYLMTTSNSDQTTTSFLSPNLMNAWVAGREIDQDRMQLAQKQFDFFCEELKRSNPYSSENDTLVVARARNYLSLFSGTERVYRGVLAEADKGNPSIDFNKNNPGSADVVIDRAIVDGSFTKGGWTFVQSALQNLTQHIGGEKWVLGPEGTSNLDLGKIGTDLRGRYQQDYIERWRAFLKGAAVVRYAGLGDSVEKLGKLSNNTSPLLALFCTAAYNTSVDPDVAKAFQPVQSVVSKDCMDQSKYVGDANRPYIMGLSGLQSCLDRANQATGDKDAAKAQCQNDAQSAKQAANQIGQGFNIDQDGHIDQIVQNLLLQPIAPIAALLKPGPVSGVSLCAQMGPLLSKFPFNPQATQEVSTQDLDSFFNPGTGALTQYYNQSLKNLLLPEGASYIANPQAAQPPNPAFLAFFNHAIGVQNALYPAGSKQIQFKYSLRPHPTESVTGLTLSIDGQELNYTGASTLFQQFTWPGGGQGATLMVRIAGGPPLGFANYPGTWGVFHFFASADKTTPNGGIFNVQWEFRGPDGRPVTGPNGKPVTVQFDVDTSGAPFILQKGILSMKCVSNVAG